MDSDIRAGAFGLGANVLAVLLDIVDIKSILDASIITVVTLLITFYGNRLLRWIHKEKK